MTDNLKFEYRHIRNYDEHHTVRPRGGMTICYVCNEGGDVLETAYSQCHPNDNFNKKLGRLISSGRAIKKLEEGA